MLSYRSETESNFIDTYDFLDETKEKDFYAKWSFFKLENSNYIEFPGDGIRVDTSLKYTFTLVKYGTILYQKG